MTKLVKESLVLNEMDPQTMQALSYAAGGLGVLLTGTGIAYLQHALKNSDSELAKKLGKVLAGLGKGAAEGTQKGPSTTLGESALNEMADPALAELATYMGGALSVILAAGGLTALQQKLASSKNPNTQKFAKILSKLGKSSAEGTSKAPPSI